MGAVACLWWMVKGSGFGVDGLALKVRGLGLWGRDSGFGGQGTSFMLRGGPRQALRGGIREDRADVLGAILWACIAKSRQHLHRFDVWIPPRRALRGEDLLVYTCIYIYR